MLQTLGLLYLNELPLYIHMSHSLITWLLIVLLWGRYYVDQLHDPLKSKPCAMCIYKQMYTYIYIYIYIQPWPSVSMKSMFKQSWSIPICSATMMQVRMSLYISPVSYAHVYIINSFWACNSIQLIFRHSWAQYDLPHSNATGIHVTK